MLRPRRLDLPTRVLIVCPDSMELAFLTGALSGHFTVLAAHDAREAERLTARFGPCQLAYVAFGVDDDPAPLLQALDGLASCVHALLREASSQAADKIRTHGCLDGVCRLPLSPDALLARTRQALGLGEPDAPTHRLPRTVLTREEVHFLIGRPLTDPPALPA